jgi:hypothetical protein
MERNFIYYISDTNEFLFILSFQDDEFGKFSTCTTNTTPGLNFINILWAAFTPGVNFMNVLRAAFAPTVLRQ